VDEEQVLAILERIEAHLIARGTPRDVQQAIEDVFNAYGQISQMREVLHELVKVVREHDRASREERAELNELLVQLRELARKQVHGLSDVARAVGSVSEAWNGKERRK